MDTSKNIGKIATRSESSVDKGWDASKLNTNTKNTTTMENKNKCLFSIRLENGIVITGENPYEVKNFLLDLTLCVEDAIDSKINVEITEWKKYLKILKTQLDNAWKTIDDNEKK